MSGCWYKKIEAKFHFRSLRCQLRLLMILSIVTLFAVLTLAGYLFMEQTKKTAAQMTQEMLGKISHQINDTIENIDSLGFSVSANTHVQEYLMTDNAGRRYIELFPELTALTNSILFSRNDLSDIVLIDQSNRIKFSSLLYQSAEILKSTDLQAIHDIRNQTVNLPMVTYGKSRYLPFVRNIYGTSVQTGIMRYLGCCMIIVRSDALNDLIMDLSITEDAELMIVDQYNKIIASNIESSVDRTLQESLQINNNTLLRADGQRCMVQTEVCGTYTIYSIIPLASLTSSARRIMMICIGLACIAALIFFFTGCSISKQITDSVTQLQHFLRHVTSRSSIEHLNLDGPEEMLSISSDINDMLDQLVKSQETALSAQSELYETQLLNRKTQLMALQQQINPHFLYNMLGCLAGLGAAKNAPEVTRMATAMAQIFRYSVKGNDLVPVSEEVACVQSYFDIILIRYNGKIKTELSVSEDARDCIVPKMMLQPLAENAVVHGFELNRQNGNVRICIRKDDDFLICTITDNGVGMEADTLEKVRKLLVERQADEGSESIGLRNISERLWLIFGDQAQFSIDSIPQQGTTISLHIPVQRS